MRNSDGQEQNHVENVARFEVYNSRGANFFLEATYVQNIKYALKSLQHINKVTQKVNKTSAGIKSQFTISSKSTVRRAKVMLLVSCASGMANKLHFLMRRLSDQATLSS